MESASRTAAFWSMSSVAAPCLAGARAALEGDSEDVDTPRRCPHAPLGLVDSVLPRAPAASEVEWAEVFAVAVGVSVEASAAVTVVDTAAVVAMVAIAGRVSDTSRTGGVVKLLRRERQLDLAAEAGLEAMVGMAAATVQVEVVTAAAAMATGTATGIVVPAAATVSPLARSASTATAIVRVGMAATTTPPASAATTATATKTPGASAGTECGLMSVPAQPRDDWVCAKRLPFSSSFAASTQPTPLHQQG